MRSLMFGLTLFAMVRPAWTEEVARLVDLSTPGTANEWVFLRKGACIRDGELVLDGLTQVGVTAFVTEPTVSDMTLTRKVYVEPTGKGVRAFEVRFHSSDSVSDQYVDVNRGRAILCWSRREWTDRLKIYEYRRGSFGYTGIVEIEPGKLLFVYDRHDAYPAVGQLRNHCLSPRGLTMGCPRLHRCFKVTAKLA